MTSSCCRARLVAVRFGLALSASSGLFLFILALQDGLLLLYKQELLRFTTSPRFLGGTIALPIVSYIIPFHDKKQAFFC